MWDHIGTLHNAVPDYGREPRLMRRCQVWRRIFDPDSSAQLAQKH